MTLGKKKDAKALRATRSKQTAARKPISRMKGSSAARPSTIAQHKAGAAARAQWSQEQQRRLAAKQSADAALAESAGTELAETPVDAAPVKKQRSKLLLVLAALGPGFVTAMAGNDAGGISTYSIVGAKFGCAT